ncbi:SMI1/KNR4 family protein [Bacillus thuringiensis]|uniref:SMI1 / KNR4 family n=2 Tax=Bacillus cereus TaxID=1396 RepID=B7JD56_BACC0|nr:SMI1 / KNR4 family [Bacillus cereus AH820]ACO30906.1 SMI1/KNR4 family protein [Bacillus cereus 03BB102]AJG60258.1 SMI1 / KNR4 family protein [Bacillus cereus D17]AJH63433.1 SMI1 / KNR4 family protein [Bacillus cereus]EEL16450.1 SMI1 / KNR4 [Bacillus cereus 95/8201]KAA0753491.1 SMI1/KNR4 family protein [Bacillus sp. AY1-10]MBG9580268.1 SMI1/KNR4 family protein [Bacillus thuringiensis]TEA52850.1 SMI1/KNR4 family protein [Bacillus sp. BH2]
MVINWKERITTLVLVKQELMKQDVEQIWQHHFPEVGASEEYVHAFEQEWGYKLDLKYRDFLKHANGWKGFYQTVDLFGIEQLKKSTIMEYAQMLLTVIDDDVLKESGVVRQELLPIAVTEFDKDLFVLCLPNSSRPGEIIWFAGEEIDRFKNFDEYFLAMVDYNREEILALKNYIQ